MNNKIVIFSLLLISLVNNVFSQITNTKKWRKSESDSMEMASYLLEESKFLKALPIYEKLYIAHPNEVYLKYCFGKCALYRNDMHQKALELLSAIYDKNKKVVDIEFDLAKAKHYNYKFDEAIVLLDKFLSRKKINPLLKSEAIRLKQNCINAKLFYSSPTEATVTNLGNTVNSENNEIIPLLSADELMMLLTYSGKQSTGGLQNDIMQPDIYGKYFDDIFISTKENGLWKLPEPIKTINTNANESAVALSLDGKQMFVYKDTADGHGDIYLSKFNQGKWTFPEKLKGEVNSYSWEGACSLTADGKYLYFSSERGGGFGGKDIYRATLMADSTWNNIINLGDSINTAYDDDTPFMHADGVTFFYSSKGKNSMGGYDIYQATFQSKDSTFTKIVNLGYPVNTPEDDKNYILSVNGSLGYYAKGESDGQGLNDIYAVTSGYIGTIPSLSILKGIVLSDGQPVVSDIFVESISDKKQFTNLKSNNTDGSYLIALPKGNNYILTYTYKSFPSKTFTISTINLDGFSEAIYDVNFKTGDTLKIINSQVLIEDTLKAALVNQKRVTKKNAVALVKSEAFEPNNALQAKTQIYAQKYGSISSKGLEFKVQFAAFRYPKNLSYDNLKKVGKINELLLGDGITRLTIGESFKTLSEAFECNKKVVKAGQKDAFVTILFNGKRVFLEELERMGIFIP